MLADLLDIIAPDALATAFKDNPVVIMNALSKLETYRSFGSLLTEQQQICISNNLNKLNDFFKSENGKEAVSILAEEFVNFINSSE